MNKEYWFCFIGPEERENICGDAPLRNAVKSVYESEISCNYECSSGWGVSEKERNLFSSISGLKILDKNEHDNLIDEINNKIIKIHNQHDY